MFYPHPEKQLLRITEILPETPDAKSFVLQPVTGGPINYKAGQFLTFVFSRSDGTEQRRNYSLSSIPADGRLQITVKRIANGEYSRWLIDRAKPGDELFTTGASGFFVLPEDVDTYQQLVFFAAGSGITPVYAMMLQALRSHPSIRVLLVYSNRDKQSTIFYYQLRQLVEQHSGRLSVEFLFSDSTDVLHKRLGIYVMERLLAQYLPDGNARRMFYLCGPFEYMRTITIVLRNHGVTASHIRKEIFAIGQPVHHHRPPDEEPHEVIVAIGGKTFRFTARYPDTILQTAKKLKIPMPYSCEAGQCGTCSATCISGKVWMWHNDVLLDEEIRSGKILTCTGYAVGGDVVLEYAAD